MVMILVFLGVAAIMPFVIAWLIWRTRTHKKANISTCKWDKIICISKVCVSVVMIMHFLLLLLFVPHDNLILFGVAPWYLGYIVFNTILAFRKNQKPVASLIILLIVLFISVWATGFISSVAHGGALILTSVKKLPFTIISYIVVAIITSILSVICILLSTKKTKQDFLPEGYSSDGQQNI